MSFFSFGEIALICSLALIILKKSDFDIAVRYFKEIQKIFFDIKQKIYLHFDFFDFKQTQNELENNMKSKKAVVIVFPGSNCDQEALDALTSVGFDAKKVWHQNINELENDVKLCIIPGGFSYGDYLRSGAIAASSKIMEKVKQMSEEGMYVIGICNGFQILTEAKMLKGSLMRSSTGHFSCKNVFLDVNCENGSIFTQNMQERVQIQIANADGRFFCDDETLDYLKKNNLIAFKYCDNFNGSKDSIAGIIGGTKRNILGMMPHPERTFASADGMQIFKNIFNSL